MFDGKFFDETEARYMPEWAREALESGKLHYGGRCDDEPPCTLFIDTLEGTMIAQVGDYIIQGVNGEIYPCKPDIFSKTYEPVESEGEHAE